MGKWKVNSYKITYRDHSMLIDVGGNKNEIEKSFNVGNYKGLLITHGHFDHIGDIHEFITKGKIPLYLNSADKKLLARANLYRKIMDAGEYYKTPTISETLDDLTEIEFLDKKIEIIHTPGHTQGSVSFVIDKNLFVGDLFTKEGNGRTDMPGGNITQLQKSIEMIFSKFKGFKIYPGHGDSFIL